MKNRGFNIVEILIYSALVAMLLAIVVNILLLGVNMYRRFDAARNIQEAAVAVIERIVSESRNASMISVDASGVDANGQNFLTMFNSDNNVLATFAITTNGTVNVYNGSGTLVGPLTTSDVSAAGSYFLIASSTQQLARVVLVLRSGQDQFEVTEHFYTSVIPRGSYSQ